ncbi:hypothetical protein GN956_G14286 [Arapaima gigas]
MPPPVLLIPLQSRGVALRSPEKDKRKKRSNKRSERRETVPESRWRFHLQKMFFIHLICYSSAALLIGAKEAELRRVWPGETVTLSCGIPDGNRDITWFAQQPDHMPFIIMTLTFKRSGQERATEVHRHEKYRGRVSSTCESSTESNCLQVKNVTEEDLLLYYCCCYRSSDFTFGNATRLLFPEVSSPTPRDPVTPATFPPEGPKRGFPLPCGTLPCVGFLLASLACIYQLYHGRGPQ